MATIVETVLNAILKPRDYPFNYRFDVFHPAFLSLIE